MDKLPTIRRLPTYLHLVRELMQEGSEFVSSSHLGGIMGVDAILVRKDLEITGISGTPRLGYRTGELKRAIEDFLGWSDSWDAFLVGVGNLGSALLGYQGLDNYGINVVAAFDSNPDKVGRSVRGIPIYGLERLPGLVADRKVRLAILTIPPQHAQEVTDLLVRNGITGIWNFTTAHLEVPPGIITHKEDIFSGLAVLSAKMARTVAALPKEGSHES
ncbi:redox-sensing transcriptional repressor Rex [Geomonas sp. RF6]|uniref:redox-sensing transcriptional repressor Rex n=1 Tax=Geomonas sp. RF6 TaxID=2897342 RepID=UPI001E327768|nr:redox-sensing transcriptional repressor Rex [Geomonas sp. RF6]UFS72808.1 redox-sensing transcriptional repressor Rex [Geomonas sp. RF6]